MQSRPPSPTPATRRSSRSSSPGLALEHCTSQRRGRSGPSGEQSRICLYVFCIYVFCIYVFLYIDCAPSVCTIMQDWVGLLSALSNVNDWVGALSTIPREHLRAIVFFFYCAITITDGAGACMQSLFGSHSRREHTCCT